MRNIANFILFKVKNETGMLAKAIHTISEYGFNMRSIKSRAIPNEPWSYYFHVEMEGSLDETSNEMLEQLKKHCSDVKLLGAYNKYEGEF